MKGFSLKYFFPLALLMLLPLAAQARPLSSGMTGSDVTALQQALIGQGYLTSGSAVGHFGPVTLAAVKKFQCKSGIVCSGSAYGIVGPKTQAALGLSSSATSAGLEVTGWIPYWRAQKGVSDILPHISQFTSVMPFGFTVTTSGDLYDAANIGLDPWTTLIAQAHTNKVKVIPTVMWANGAAIDATLRDSTMRANQEQEIVNAVLDNNLDGIDIDYEGKLHETEPYFSTFLTELHTQLAANKKLLYCTIEARTPTASLYYNVPVPANAGQYANDFTVINKACDRVQLMTYDQQTADLQLSYVSSTTPYIPVADPAWVTKVVKLAAQTISKSKLEIGVATYGYEWQVTPLQSGFRYDLQWAFDPNYATTLMSELNLTPLRNRAGELSVSYLPATVPQSVLDIAAAGGATDTSSGSGNAVASTTYTDGSSTPTIAPTFNVLWWSDATAISHEVALARQLGIKGIAIFKLDGGEDQNMWNVLPKGAR